MHWQTLYSARRAGDLERRDINPELARNSFLRDYDRIIFSSAFRRLQNKTQVFPLPGSVFVHNRLTHSLEVASVGRSIGKNVGDALAKKYPNESDGFKEFYKYELPSVIAAACLAHDIGNPPFGHSGEDAIRTYFTEMDVDIKKIINDHLSKNQVKDFEYFEGNSNALRILTHSFRDKLTYTTLASIVKYPCSSLAGFKENDLIATKKSGYFDSEADTYKDIARTFGIPETAGRQDVYARHPFVYLTEAADDICYRVIDLEDAHRLQIISIEKFKELFLPFFDELSGYNSKEYIQKKLVAIDDNNQKVQYIRARWIGLMTEKLSQAFMDNEAALLTGTLQKDLMKCLPEKDYQLIKEINSFSVKNIYNYRPVVEIELAGYNVIGGLLKELLHAVLYDGHTKSGKIVKIIPNQFPITRKRENLYADVQSVVDFISGMTDLYAIDLYRKITGITIPELR
jgi:dGTPase